MTRPGQWSREALDDIKEQIVYISRDNPRAARLVADRIRDVVVALGEMASGRQGRVTGTYEKPVPQVPYIIAYALITTAGQEKIAILRIIHMARDGQNEDWPSERQDL